MGMMGPGGMMPMGPAGMMPGGMMAGMGGGMMPVMMAPGMGGAPGQHMFMVRPMGPGQPGMMPMGPGMMPGGMMMVPPMSGQGNRPMMVPQVGAGAGAELWGLSCRWWKRSAAIAQLVHSPSALHCHAVVQGMMMMPPMGMAPGMMMPGGGPAGPGGPGGHGAQGGKGED